MSVRLINENSMALRHQVLPGIGFRLNACFLCWLFCAQAQSLSAKQQSSFGSLFHTGWNGKDGVPANINALAQTTDGFLWIATEAGLYRFDAVTFERFQSQSGPAMLSDGVSALLAQTDGGLWIGYVDGGTSLLNHGTVQNFGEKEGLGRGYVSALARDFDGTIWAATALGLKRFNGSRWVPIGGDWNFAATKPEELYVDHQGILWVASNSTLAYLRRGERRFHITAVRFSDLLSLSGTPEGVLLTSGIKGLIIPFLLSPNNSFLRGSPIALRSLAISVDRQGMLWIATTSDGVWRLPAPQWRSPPIKSGVISADNHFTRKDGLTSDEGTRVLEDAESNVWIATSTGLDRFRHAKLNSVPLPSGAYGLVMSPADEGGILVTTGAVPPGILHVSRDRIEPVKGAPAFLSHAYRDPGGTLWLGGLNAIWKYSKKKFVRVPLPPDMSHFRVLQAMTTDTSGSLWIAKRTSEVFRLAHGQWTKFGGMADLPRLCPTIIYTDASDRVWFGYEQNQMAVLEGNRVKTFSSRQGLNVGNITAISEKRGEVWIGGTLGLQRFDGAQFVTLMTATSELRDISGIIERSNGELWLNQRSGVVRIDHEEIRKFQHAPRHPVQFQLFNTLDGLPGAPLPATRLPSGMEAFYVTLWFTTSTGLVWLDPDHIPTNHIIPHVLIQSMKADDKTYEASKQLTFSSRVQNLVINYTAPSLSMPERVRFRYRLEGFDQDWQQAGTRRQAFYSQLAPGDYRFRVAACNDDGLWNWEGATYPFTITPTYYQTAWFKALLIVTALLTLAGLYQLRLRQLGQQLQLRYEERLAERTRIARELHDTLLQSFHGLILRFQAAQNMLPERPTQAITALGIAIERAAKAITESRDAVQELRSSQMDNEDLTQAVSAVGREFEADYISTMGSSEAPKFRVLVEGKSRRLHPTVQDNVYRIMREAISNAFRHARASNIEVDIRYGRRKLRLRVRDDGIGMNPTVFLDRHRTGHWGLPGMRERAKGIGGHFELWSEIHNGTEIEITVPASIAFKASGAHSV